MESSGDGSASSETVPNFASQKITASEKKLKSGASMSMEEDIPFAVLDVNQRSVGFRMIDLECLSKALSKLHMCKEGKL